MASEAPAPPRGTRLTSDGRTLRWWAEIATIVAFYLVYSAVRNANQGGAQVAFSHARVVIDWERALGLYHEETIQDWALRWRPLVIAMNYAYGSLHFIVTAWVGVRLFRRHPDHYPLWRNVLGCTTGLALVGFLLWPLMPPRLVPDTYGFVDTLSRYPTFWSFDSGGLQRVSNQFAAMPSLHFAWSLFCVFALAPRFTSPRSRILLGCYPLLTLAAIVITGNHFVLDAAGGAFVLALGFILGRQLTRLAAPRPA